MVTYTVFPFMASGVAPAFHCIDRADDASAAAEALKLLADHHGAVRVTVWREDALVFSGPSATCAAWLTATPQCLAECPAISHPDQSCRPGCGRLTAPAPQHSILRAGPKWSAAAPPRARRTPL